MTDPHSPDRDVLPCGRAVADLVDQADAGHLEPVDAHQAGCRWCRSALQDAAVAADALDLLRDPPAELPRGIVDRVMRGVRARAPRTMLELPVPGAAGVAGSIRVRPQVLADVARAAAARWPGVTVTTSSVAVGGEGLEGVVQVSLSVLVDGSRPLPELGEAVRGSVRRALGKIAGVRDTVVDLTVLDLVPGSGDEGPASPSPV